MPSQRGLDSCPGVCALVLTGTAWFGHTLDGEQVVEDRGRGRSRRETISDVHRDEADGLPVQDTTTELGILHCRVPALPTWTLGSKTRIPNASLSTVNIRRQG